MKFFHNFVNNLVHYSLVSINLNIHMHTPYNSSMDERNLSKDPKRVFLSLVWRLQDKLVFQVYPDQESAQKMWHSEVDYSVRTTMTRPTQVNLSPGDTVLKGEKYYYVRLPFSLAVHSVDYNTSNSKQPDGSVIHFPSKYLDRN